MSCAAHDLGLVVACFSFALLSLAFSLYCRGQARRWQQQADAAEKRMENAKPGSRRAPSLRWVADQARAAARADRAHNHRRANPYSATDPSRDVWEQHYAAEWRSTECAS